MKKKETIIISILLTILIVVMITIGEKEEVKNTNYIKEKTSGGEIVYTIDDTKYIETEEKTDLIKIDVNEYGVMIAELYPEIAPITVENYKKLVSEKFYDNLIFHRVIKDFIIQTGDPNGNGSGGSKDNIKGEFSENGIKNDLSHTRGVLSMARRGANPDTDETRNSASSQFFIVHADSQFLDGKYAAFGKVVKGFDVIDSIASISTNEDDKPTEEIKINSIRFIEEYESGENID